MVEPQDRRSVVEQMRKQQSAQRRRSILTTSAIALVGVGVVAAAVAPMVRDQTSASAQGDVSAAAANCGEEITKPATGGSDHRPNNEQITYPEAPPAFGPHYAAPVAMERKFYTSDRPDVATLVHNLEHGFTVLWYDQSIAEDKDALAHVEAIADSYPATSGVDDKFIAAPWTSQDGEAFPDDTHVALTHWSLGGGDPTDPSAQVGVWLYCEQPSSEVVDQFVADYPFTDAPEGMVPGEYGETTN